jgi:hypothetical protein
VHLDNPVASNLPSTLSSYLFHCLRSAETVEILHQGFNAAGVAAVDDTIDANTEDVMCHVHALQCATYAGSAPQRLDHGAGEGRVGESHAEGQMSRVDPPCLDRSHGARVTFEYSFAGMRLTVNGGTDLRSQQLQFADSYSKVNKRPTDTASSDEGEPQIFRGKLRGFARFPQHVNGTIPSAPSALPIILNTESGDAIGVPEAWESIKYPLCYYTAQLEDEDTPQGTTVQVLVGVKCRAIVVPSDDDEDNQPRSLHEVLADVEEFELQTPAEQTYVLPGTVYLEADVVGVRDGDQGSQSSEEDEPWPN